MKLSAFVYETVSVCLWKLSAFVYENCQRLFMKLLKV